jgi:hypothetical protein
MTTRNQTTIYRRNRRLIAIGQLDFTGPNKSIDHSVSGQGKLYEKKNQRATAICLLHRTVIIPFCLFPFPTIGTQVPNVVRSKAQAQTGLGTGESKHS